MMAAGLSYIGIWMAHMRKASDVVFCMLYVQSFHFERKKENDFNSDLGSNGEMDHTCRVACMCLP